MGAELHDVRIEFDGSVIAYADKVSFKRKLNTSNKNTFDGDVNFAGKSTGGTISIDRIYWPDNLDDAIELENKLAAGKFDVITCTGTGYTGKGDPYQRVVTGLKATVTTDDEGWSPSEGISSSLEVSVNELTRKSKRA